MKRLKKPVSKKAPIPVVTVPQNKEADKEDSESQFQVELYWCIHEIQNAINSGKLEKNKLDDAIKNCKILKSRTAQLVKKRQLMKSLFGDYRTKMKDEEKKLGLGSKNIKFTQTPFTQNSSFVKKSAIVTSERNFKFNFSVDRTESDQVQSKTVDENCKIIQSNEPFKFNFNVDEEVDFQSLAI